MPRRPGAVVAPSSRRDDRIPCRCHVGQPPRERVGTPPVVLLTTTTDLSTRRGAARKDPARGRPESRRTLVILAALTAFGPLAIDTYLPALPELATDLRTSTASVQLTLTACLLGMAAGQLLGGPVSDTLGRRRPILTGVAGFAVLSVGCALAPSVWVLIALRFLQGFGGGVAVVVARAVVRDRHEGTDVARVLSLMMVVNGAAPVLAPIIGAAVLEVAAWPAIFVLLGGVGVLIFGATALGLPESLPAHRRHRGGLAGTLSVFGTLASDRSFVGCALASALPLGAMFAYIAGSPFVLQERYGLSPAGFSIVFGTNALGIAGAAMVGNRFVGRVGPRRLLVLALAAGCAGGVGLLVAVVLDAGLAPVLLSLFVVVSIIGLVSPTATALGLAHHADVAGSASALLGLLPFAMGAAAAPLVGLAGATEALPLAIVIAVLELAALAQFLVLTRRTGDGRPRLT